MGKKSRRKAKLRAAARLAVQSATLQPVNRVQPVAAQVTKPVAEPKATAPTIQTTALISGAHHYDYVVPELRLIGIIAGSLFIILFILAFILH
jgi:hypothetical protein